MNEKYEAAAAAFDEERDRMTVTQFYCYLKGKDPTTRKRKRVAQT